MKKLLFIIAAAVLVCSFVSCEKTKEDILRELIENEVKSTMNDPKSYEFVSMSPVDSIMSNWEDEEKAKKLKIFVSMYESENKALYAKSDNPSFSYNKRIAFLEKVGSNNNKIDSLEREYLTSKTEYKPYSTGCYTIFKFRGNNELGVKVINSLKVVLNKELTEIKEIQIVE